MKKNIFHVHIVMGERLNTNIVQGSGNVKFLYTWYTYKSRIADSTLKKQ